MGKYREYYKTLSLHNLRRRQNITRQQIEFAHQNKKTRALIRLQRVYDLLSDVVSMRTGNEKDTK
jgi:hypothetical protein